MKFTKGPWEAKDIPSAGWQIYAEVDLGKDERRGVIQPIYNVNVKPMLFVNNEGTVTAVIAYEDWRQFPSINFQEMQAANSRLIAAAPRLYNALKKLYESIDSCVDLTPEVMKEAKDALSEVI